MTPTETSSLHRLHFPGACVVLALLSAGCGRSDRTTVEPAAQVRQSGPRTPSEATGSSTAALPSAAAIDHDAALGATGRVAETQSEDGPATKSAPVARGEGKATQAVNDAGRPAETLESAGFPPARQVDAVMATVRIVNPVAQAEGSGVVVHQRDGAAYVLTACHVVDGADVVDIHAFSAATYPKPARVFRSGTIIGRSPERDLAAVRVQSDDFSWTILPLATPKNEALEPDTPVMTVGCSRGSPPTPKLDRVLASRLARRPDTDTAVRLWEVADEPSAGRSGGPLVNRQGLLVGVASGSNSARGYYTSLSEIWAFLKNVRLDFLSDAQK